MTRFPQRSWARWGMGLLLVAVINTIATTGGIAQPTRPGVAPVEGTKTAPEPVLDPVPTLPNKQLKLSIDAKKWDNVFNWLTQETTIPVIAAAYPAGSFSFQGPPEKSYSLWEVIDIINIGLLSNRESQKYILLTGDKAFVLVGADEKIDPSFIREVTPAQAMTNPRSTELVRMKRILNNQVAGDLALELKPLLGPFGRIDVLSRSNQLLITETSGNLRRLNRLIEEVEQNKTSGETYEHVCKFITPRQAEKTLIALMGDPKVLFPNVSPADPKAVMPGKRPFFFEVQDRTNMILVSGGQDKLNQAKEILGRIDVPDHKDQAPLPKGPPGFKTYPVRAGNADALVKTLVEQYKGTNVAVTALSTNSIMVYAGPADQIEIARLIAGDVGLDIDVQVFDSGGLDATKLATTLKSMYGDAKAGAPFIEADDERGQIIVRGNELQLQDVAKAMKAITGVGAGGMNSHGNMRAFTIDQGSAMTLAEAMQRLMNGMRPNVVEIVTPDGTVIRQGMGPKTPAIVPPVGPKLPVPMPMPQPETRNPLPRPALGGGAATVIFDPRLQVIAQAQPADETPVPKPVKISAFGNRLVVVSDDPEMLALSASLVKLLTKTPAGEGDFEVIRLKYAIAAEAAKVLDEAFNGPQRPQQGGQQGGRGQGAPGGGRGGPGGGEQGGGFNPLSMMMQFAGVGASAPNSPRENRIRIVADTQTNSLLVRATPLDLLSIKRLLEKALDTGETDSKAIARTYKVVMRNMQASEALTTLKEVYKEQLNPSQNQQRQAPTGFPFGPRPMTEAGQFKNVTLTLGVETTSNAIIANCTESLFLEIQKLCMELDELALGQYKIGKRERERLLSRGFPEAISGRLQAALGVNPETGDPIEYGYKEFLRLVRTTTPELMNDRFKDDLLEICRVSESQIVVQYIPLDGVDPKVVEQALRFAQGQSLTTGRTGFGGTGTGTTRGGFNQGGGFTPGGGGFTPGGGGFTPGGGGFTPGGGGFTPGGGGFTPGGGGFTPGGGGFTPGGTRGGRGGRTSALPGDPDFFVSAVKDDPKTNLYDPRESAKQPNVLQPVSYQELPQPVLGAQPGTTFQPMPPMPPAPAAPLPGASPEVPAPRGVVTLQTVGNGILVRGRPEDLKELRDLIDQLSKTPISSSVETEILPLAKGDATSVTATLQDLFQRLASGVGRTAGGQQGGQFGQQGGQFGQQGFPGLQPGAQVGPIEAGLSSIILIPLPRFNAIFVGGTKAQLSYVKKEVEKLDRSTTEGGQARAFALEKAAAQRVAQLIQSFYATRYSSEPGGAGGQQIGGGQGAQGSTLNQIRVTFDAGTNTVFVQAAPADMAEIADLIKWVDSAISLVKNDIRVVQLNNAVASEVAGLLVRAITDAVQGGQIQAGGNQQGQFGQQGQQGQFGQQQGGQFGQQGQTTGQIVNVQTTGIATKAISLRFQTPSRNGNGGKEYISGILEDVHINPDTRTNRLVISAPNKTMELILKLLEELDVPPAARSEVKVFPLKRADATQASTLLQNLFLGRATGATGQQGGQFGQQGGQFGQQGGTTGQNRPILPAIGGELVPGATIIDIRLGVDVRTNSILAAGSANDMIVVEAILNRLEDADNVQERRNEVYSLRNSVAVDVANALSTFYTNSLTVLQRGQQLNAFNSLDREVVIVPEPITNKLLISATPRFYNDVLRMIAELDAEPPQVMIQVLIAEVDLLGTEEFGMEIGLQAPVLFSRGVGFNQTQTGVTVTNVTTASPGFNFNNPALGLPGGVVSQGIVGWQGLNAFGVGRQSSTGGPGGFVLAASSDVFSLLVRALKTQGRLDILSRPQVMTLDNQSARVFVGQNFPLVTGFAVNLGTVVPNIQYQPVGIELLVTPKIQPDGRVLMRVTPGISSVSPTTVALGNGVNAQAINQQVVDTTVVASDGETIAVGGLISQRDTKAENKVPWLGDLPFLGAAFRYRTQVKNKAELLVIMTPHVVRNEADRLRLLNAEASRMDWMVGDVAKLWDNGNDPILNPRRRCTDMDGSLPDVQNPVLPPVLPQSLNVQPQHTIAPQIPVQNGPVVLPNGALPAPTTQPAPGIPGPVVPGQVVPGQVVPSQPQGATEPPAQLPLPYPSIPGQGQPQPLPLPLPNPQGQPLGQPPPQVQPTGQPQTRAIQQLLPPVQPDIPAARGATAPAPAPRTVTPASHQVTQPSGPTAGGPVPTTVPASMAATVPQGTPMTGALPPATQGKESSGWRLFQRK